MKNIYIPFFSTNVKYLWKFSFAAGCYTSLASAALVKAQGLQSWSADFARLSSQSSGAKEKIVTRIIVSRCEVDLKKICSEFKTAFGKSLQETIEVGGQLLI